MIEAYAVGDVYAAEHDLMDRLPSGELMRRAVAGLVQVLGARLDDLGSGPVVALAGPGNNGADALYAAAALAATGREVAALHLSGAVHQGALAAAVAAGVALAACDERGLPRPADPADPGDDGDDGGTDTTQDTVDDCAATGVGRCPATEMLARARLVVDGMLGIGGRAGLPQWGVTWLAAVPDSAYLLAVDLPSGQDPAGQAGRADAVFADETVTFSVAKPVHLLPATEPAVGALSVVDIGLDLRASALVRRVTRDDVAVLWPTPGPRDDKYSRGVLGVVAGGEEYTGAGLLAVRAAVRSGVGMVRYVGTPTPQALVRAAVPEAVHGPGRVQAWVVGPGLQLPAQDDDHRAQLAAARDALAGEEPVLVDAGGLDLLDAATLDRRTDLPTLLTPHAGECARLLNRLTADDDTAGDPPGATTRAQVEADPVGHARRLAALTGAHVLLKGSTTLVVGPADEQLWTQPDAPAWLATAGAGDVLAGVVGTLLAAGLPVGLAGALGAHVHGVAADLANPGGPVSAGDVADAIPSTLARLLARRGWEQTHTRP